MQSNDFYRITDVIIGSFSNASVGKSGYIIDDRIQEIKFHPQKQEPKCTHYQQSCKIKYC